jgi:hypothetical protein
MQKGSMALVTRLVDRQGSFIHRPFATKSKNERKSERKEKRCGIGKKK